ncbi:PTS sugar transporter subunit IIB [Olsenella sp. An290]|uniref:PTS sugar transporter subunit IIB n=1 Tax=Olsenella sp. An290 TaxID=1965625 RepID=UPI000B3A7E9C|nr:PTS sugar transporter subunit IIB [Olsenella sp. An290]OUO35601.1 PTS galactitol transporter subunit IIB [Olsenella sp. An290]
MAARIVVACGSGVATSEMVAAKIRKLLEAEGVEAEVVAVEIAEVERALEGADVYVPVVNTESASDVPVVSGVAFLTGINQEKELARLLELVRDH